VYHSILTGIAQGDGKTHSSFKRAKVDEDVGKKAIEELVERGIIRVAKANNTFSSWEKNEKVDNKLYFTAPFLRFWFAFVSPLFKGVRDGDFKEVKERFSKHEQEFIQLTFKELSQTFLQKQFKDDAIVEMGSYWDRENEFDIYAKTKSGKTIVGNCRYTKSKTKKSELTRLQNSALNTKIKADIFVLFSLNGYSNELKSLKSDTLKLYSLKHFKALL